MCSSSALSHPGNTRLWPTTSTAGPLGPDTLFSWVHRGSIHKREQGLTVQIKAPGFIRIPPTMVPKLPLLPEVFRRCGWRRLKQWITWFIIPTLWPSQRAGMAPQLTGPQKCLWVWALGKPVVWGLFCFHCEPNFQQFLCPGWLLLIYVGFKTTDWSSRVNSSAVAY